MSTTTDPSEPRPQRNVTRQSSQVDVPTIEQSSQSIRSTPSGSMGTASPRGVTVLCLGSRSLAPRLAALASATRSARRAPPSLALPLGASGLGPAVASASEPDGLAGNGVTASINAAPAPEGEQADRDGEGVAGEQDGERAALLAEHHVPEPERELDVGEHHHHGEHGGGGLGLAGRK